MIITEQRSGQIMKEEVKQPLHFTSCGSQGTIFSLRGRSRNGRLLLRLQRNESVTKKSAETCDKQQWVSIQLAQPESLKALS